MITEDIRYFVQFDDGYFMGQKGENVPAADWFIAMAWQNFEEANRWASEKAGNRMWRIRTHDIALDVLINVSAFTTPLEATAYMILQETMFAD